MTAPRFYNLPIARVSPAAAGAVAITLAVPPNQREAFNFKPGQFLTVRATINGADVRRSYSISSPASLLTRQGELTLGIRPVENGVFFHWAATALKADDTLAVMPIDGRFTVHKPRARPRKCRCFKAVSTATRCARSLARCCRSLAWTRSSAAALGPWGHD